MSHSQAQSKQPLEFFDSLWNALTAGPGKSRRVVLFVGAGISLDPPSNLLPTGAFMREILDRLFDDPDDRRMIGRYVDGAWAGKLTAGNFLRFEALMQVLVHASGDSDMQILQCYAACREPNLNHYRLAALLARGHWIVTTNFDTLIEIACQRLSIPFSQIVYEADFHQFDQFPDKFPNPIFKIHGSFFKGVHNSRDSMIATLSALFASGERMSGEPYKQRVLERLVKSYPLVVMGYSGADNLDISPILKETASPETLLWINHSPQPAYHDAAAILRFPRDPSGQFFNPHLNILAYLAGGHADRETAQIHLFDLDTSQVLQSMTNGYAVRWPELGLPFQYDIRRHFDDYFAGRLAAEPARRLAQFHIWDQVGSQDGLQRVLPQVESLAGALQFGLESIQILCAAAAHYRHLGESEKSLQAYERALDLAGQEQDAVAIVQVYQGLSETHHLAGRGPLALFCLGQCVGWASQAIDAAAAPGEKAYALYLRASALFSRIMLALQIGYPNRQDFDAAAVFGDFAYEKFDRYDRPHPPREGDRRIEDDLAWQAGRLQRYIHMHVREAAIYCQQALDLAQQHSLDYIQSRCFSLFSRIAVALGNRQEADSWLSQSLEIEQRFGGLILCGALHEQMADVHRQNGDWDAYLGSAQQALHIYELVEDIRGVAEMNYALGYAYQHLGQWEPSRSRYSLALRIYQYTGDRRKESHTLHQLGRLAQAEGQCETAIDFYSRSMEIKQSLGDSDGMAMTIKQLGHLYLESGDYEKAAANMLLADRLWFEIESPRQADVEPYLRHLLSLLGSARFGAIAENIRSIGERDSDL